MMLFHNDQHITPPQRTEPDKISNLVVKNNTSESLKVYLVIFLVGGAFGGLIFFFNYSCYTILY